MLFRSIDLGTIRPGEHLAITTSDGALSSIGIMVSKGDQQACLPAPPPLPAAGAGR